MPKSAKKSEPSIWAVELAPGARAKVKKGDQVKEGDLLAVLKKKKEKQLLFPFWLEKEKGVWQKGGEKHQGEAVKEGDLLYQKKKTLGRTKQWFSPAEGKIIEINEEEGWVMLLESEEEEDLFSPASGKVISVDKKKIKISFAAERLTGQGIGEKGSWGELSLLLQGEGLTNLDTSYQGKIVLVNEIDFPLLSKSQALGVAGLVGLSFPGQERREKTISLPVLILKEGEGIKTEEIKAEEIKAEEMKAKEIETEETKTEETKTKEAKRKRKMEKKKIISRLESFQGCRCYIDARGNQLLICH